jgi:hypothetical protein
VPTVTARPYCTYRPPETFWMGNFAALVFGGLALFPPDTGTRILGVAMLLMALWMAWWIRLAVTPSGLTSAFFLVRHIPWEAVRHISLDRSAWLRGGAVLTVITSKGDTVRCWAVSTNRSGDERRCRRTLQELQMAQRQHRS